MPDKIRDFVQGFFTRTRVSLQWPEIADALSVHLAAIVAAEANSAMV